MNSSITPRMLAHGVMLSLLAGFFVAGCAHDPDIRMGHDNSSGYTGKNPSAYLSCVKSELPTSAKTYTQENQGALALYVDSTDPNQATGLVEVKDSGQQHQYLAYQRDAWYDQGRLLDAALMCSRASL